MRWSPIGHTVTKKFVYVTRAQAAALLMYEVSGGVDPLFGEITPGEISKRSTL